MHTSWLFKNNITIQCVAPLNHPSSDACVIEETRRALQFIFVIEKVEYEMRNE